MPLISTIASSGKTRWIARAVALLVGGQLQGIVGALLALPIAASLRVLVAQLRIDLPGEQPGEEAQRTLDAAAEAVYAEQTEGVSAMDAVAVATVMAEQGQEEGHEGTGRVEIPIEEQGAVALRPPLPPTRSWSIVITRSAATSGVVPSARC